MTPGPFITADEDGRHKRVAILTDSPEFADEDAQPYHPLIGVVYYGGQHAPRETAQATARLWASASELLEALKEAAKVLDVARVVSRSAGNHDGANVLSEASRKAWAAVAKAENHAA
jgi:hypothetical protein